MAFFGKRVRNVSIFWKCQQIYSVCYIPKMGYSKGRSRGLQRTPINVFTTEESDAFHDRSKNNGQYSGVNSDIHKPNNLREPSHVNFYNKSGKVGGYIDWEAMKVNKKASDEDVVNSIVDDLESFNKKHNISKDESDNVVQRPSKTKNTQEGKGLGSEGRGQQTPKYRYKVLPPGDKSFVSMILKMRHGKVENRSVVLEGHLVLNDAYRAGVNIHTVYFDTVANLNKLELGDAENIRTEFYKTSTARMKLISNMQQPFGQLGICATPNIEAHQAVTPMIVILDNIRDPGDMGTLIRTAGVAGCELVIAMKGCVDIWNSKVLRAGGGAHFRLPVVNNVQWQYVNNYLPDKTFVNLVDNSVTQLDVRTNASTLAEISREVYETQQEDKFVDVNEDSNVALHYDDSYEDRHVHKYGCVPLPRVSLFDLDIESRRHVTCVISGGADGCSAAARKLTLESSGVEVFMPSAEPNIAAVNTGVFGCVAIMEAKRQLYKRGLLLEPDQEPSKSDTGQMF